jgi:BRCA1-associated RING domain protein 1
VRLLIEHNACINFKGYLDSTPLHEAVLNDKIDCVKYLLEHGADSSLRNSHGFYPKDFSKTNEINCLLNDADLQSKILNQSIITATHSSHSIETKISPARKTRKSTLRKQKKIIIYSTGMTNDEKARLNELVNKLDIKLTQEMNASVTHVVSKDGLVCQRTINYMKAVLMGIWILSVKWLEESLIAGYLLEENQYEFHGSHKIANSKASYKGRMNACVQNPSLFEGCNFYFHGDFKVFAKDDLVKLVQLAGGKILRREPKLERLEELMQPSPFHAESNLKCSHFIVYDENKPKIIIKHEYLNTLNINWVFNCIDKFKICID